MFLRRHAGLVPASTDQQAIALEPLDRRSPHGGPRHKAGVTWGILIALMLIASPAFGQQTSLADVQLRDPAKEAQARALMATIRCVECQGQSVGDSDAAIAGSMRALIRERIQAGETPGHVRAWLIERYGDYITYDPPMSAVTWPLWLAPVVLLIAGAAIARSSFRKRRQG